MAAADSAFLIEKLGTWPTETYRISPSSQLIEPRLGELPAENLLRLCNVPINEVENINTLYYNKASYFFSNQTSQYIINTDEGASFVWDLSSHRTKYNIGHQFNYFYVNINPGAEAAFKREYAYSLYPSRLFLKPVSLVKNINSWTLTTSAVVADHTTFFFKSSASEALAYSQHYNFLNSGPTFSPLPSTSDTSYVFSLSSCRQRINYPVIIFSPINNPYKTVRALEDATINSKIRPDSPCVTYSVSYSAYDGVLTLGQDRVDTHPDRPHSFRSSYILNSQSLSSTRQAFQLLQFRALGDTTSNLGDASNCILSAVIDLSSSTANYYSRYHYVNKTIYSDVTGTPGSFLGLDFISDSPILLYSLETVSSTLSTFYINSVSYNLNTPILPSIANKSIQTTTKYPPHYYSYQLSLSAPKLGFNNLTDSCYLTFSLISSAVSANSQTVVLSSFISSDYGLLKYDLKNNNVKEYIKYELLSDSFLLDLSAINVYYGPNKDTYNLKFSPWVPVSSGADLVIDYPHTPYGEATLVLRSTLSSASGFITSKLPTVITIAKNQTQSYTGSPIFLNPINQTGTTFDVSCDMLTAAPQWPTRDLRNSYITWSYSPSGLGATLSSLDLSGNIVKPLSANVPILFSPQTSYVRFSDFGLNTITIQLSSQKYNEVTTLQSNSAIQNPFDEKRFVIGPSKALDNLNKTRTIGLTALVPYHGKVYQFPTGTSLSWSWIYAFTLQPELTPIKVYYYGSGGSLTPYSYGTILPATQLSSIFVEVTPGYSTQLPDVNDVELVLTCHSQNNLFKTNYSFYVDEFPSRDLLNSDFTVSYTGYNSISATVLDTSLNQYILTRPNDNTNVFSLSSYSTSDISLSTTYVWSVSDNTGHTQLISAFYGKHPTLNLAITSTDINTTTVSLCGLSAYAVGWQDPNLIENVDFRLPAYHNIATTVTIYTPNSAEFYTPLKFITYPEYYWSGTKAVLLSASNYTLASAPTAYNNKKSNSQNFYISANKIMSEYDYSIGSQKTFLTTLNSPSATLISLPYTSEFLSNNGLTISLTAYGQMYPQTTPFQYVKPSSVGGELAMYNFNLTASSVLPSTTDVNSFEKNPTLVNFNTDVLFSYTLDSTKIDLDYKRYISLTQFIRAADSTSPVIPVSGGTATYALKSTLWPDSYLVTVPATTGTQTINLQIGDPYEPGYLTEEQINRLSISLYSTNIPFTIPSSTFSNYSSGVWPQGGDLWNPVFSQRIYPLSGDNRWRTFTAFATAVSPSIFVSNFISITGAPISVAYTSPAEVDDNNILFYRTYFGENATDGVISYKGGLAEHTYTQPGTYFIDYEAVYQDGATKIGTLAEPIIIKSKWSEYNQTHLRDLNEEIIDLPWTREQTHIQPNEWGVADIFNTSLKRLSDNLTKLQDSTQSINNDFPTVYYGWLGCNATKKGFGIRWHNKYFGGKYYATPSTFSHINKNVYKDSTVQFFNNIIDISSSGDYLYVLDDYFNVRMFLNKNYKPQEIIFTDTPSFVNQFVKPSNIEVDENGIMYILDPPSNKLYSLNIDIESQTINVSINVGGFGGRNDSSRFSAPSDLSLSENNVFVLDYNNKCVKEFTSDLNWIHTYYTEKFETDRPEYLATHFDGMCYTVSENHNLYVFDISSPSPLYITSLKEISTYYPNSVITKMTLDEAGEFLYIIASNGRTGLLFKYSALGVYIGTSPLAYNPLTIKKSSYRNLLMAIPQAIVKIQDVVDLFRIGQGLPTNMWSEEQILLKKDDFASDISYNRCLKRISQNIKTFRNNLNGKFSKVTERLSVGIVTYYAQIPVSIEEQPSLHKDVEKDTVSVGVNEFHLPQILNREIDKIYDSILSIKQFLDIYALSLPDFKVEGSGVSVICPQGFCWSWNAMSCYNLSLPSIRICNVNPITYRELESSFPINYDSSEGWTKTWDNASSDCCNSTPNPLDE